MRILLIDDHVSFCEGLIAAVTAQRPDIQFEFESNSELVPTTLIGSNKFDLLMIDIMMPGLGGIELIKHLNAMQNFTPVLVISSVEEPEVVQEALDLGVLGYIPKY
ncbi:MAG: response regulator transcription factor, partial [Pseudomonadales bacterium]|nr:response regulator transcription factor [Pseudomonadales bacterium]